MLICFASHNQDKVKEIKKLFGAGVEVLSLNDLGIDEEIEESGSTFTENALIKAHYVYNKCHVPCFADDSGLEVDALNGAPGVHSARFAGEPVNSEKNIDKLLTELVDQKNRKARFRTIVALIGRGEENCFEGIVEGTIIERRRGTNGFGYDPIFLPKNFDRTFAEMDLKEKNLISHRAQAISKLINFLTENLQN